MSDAERPAVHSITVLGEGEGALLTCRYCGATASSVIALTRIPCVFVVSVSAP